MKRNERKKKNTEKERKNDNLCLAFNNELKTWMKWKADEGTSRT